MMSLQHKMAMGEAQGPVQQIDFFSTVKNQFFYKIHAHHSMFGTMLIMQVIGLIFAYGGENWGTGTENLHISMNISSGNTIISFTFIWALIMGAMLTSRRMKSMMHTFISNKRINHISNFLFLIFLSVIGGISSFLLGFFIKSIAFLLYQAENTILVERVTVNEVLLGITVTILYMFLISTIGYLIGEIIYLHKIFIVILPGVVIGLLIVFHETAIEPIFTFFTTESNFFVFIVKVLCVAPVMFFIATSIDRSTEVR